MFEGLSFEDAACLTDPIVEFLEENQAYTQDISDYFLEKLLRELEYYIDHFDYSSVVESWCDPNFQDEVYRENYNSIINEIYRDIENLIWKIKDSIITSSIESHFKTFESTIESCIDDVFEEMLKESNKPREKSLPESNIEVDDILDRPI